MKNNLVYVVAVLIAFVAVGSEAGERGHLVLIGGGARPRPIMEKFVELAGGRDALIVVLPTASEDKKAGRDNEKLFRKEYGCTRVQAIEIRKREQAFDPAIALLVGNAGGIYFTGGDQRRITSVLRGTPVGEAITAAFARGAAVAGTSAGTACQSTLMITGEGDFEIIAAGNVELGEGLGLLEGVMLDQHFVRRSRHNRLISVILEHPELLGVGVDEATAIWVRPDDTFQVLGEGWVIVYDARAAAVNRQPGVKGRVHLGAHSLTTHILLPGETFDLETRTVTPLP